MATIGNDPSVGASTRVMDASAIRGIPITMSEAGTASSITIKASASTSGTWQCAILDASRNVLDSTATRGDIGAAGTYEFTGLTVSLSASTQYWLVVGCDGSTSSVLYHNGAGGNIDGYVAAGDADNVDPFVDPVPTLNLDGDREYCIQLTYTPSATGAASQFMGFGGRMIG